MPTMMPDGVQWPPSGPGSENPVLSFESFRDTIGRNFLNFLRNTDGSGTDIGKREGGGLPLRPLDQVGARGAGAYAEAGDT